MERIVLSERRLPVGLEGELMRIALVLSVIVSAIASGLYWNPSASFTGTCAGTPPRNRMKFG
ncbi:MAG: hypothetical protein A4E46_00847 [Methanosaeta sp. PtaU1.Bin016]|nr:MAG: hypothetical protein A4E46_00847 [Methanosaeta sp. PtaU1.Bin016]